MFLRMIKNLKLKMAARDLRVKDNELKLISILCRWLPISIAILDMIVKQLPSPKEAQKERLPSIWNMKQLPLKLKNAVLKCDSEYCECVIYVPKMIIVDKNEIIHSLHVSNERIIERNAYQRGKYTHMDKNSDDIDIDGDSIDSDSHSMQVIFLLSFILI